MNEKEETQFDRLKKRIPFEEMIELGVDESTYEQILNDLLEDSKYIAFEILYPFEDFPEELDKRYFNWQLRACIELYNLADKAGITNYSENGISWAKLSDGLSVQLLNGLTSKVGTPKRKQTEEGEEDVQS